MRSLSLLLLSLAVPVARGDWPVLRGNPQHTGLVLTDLKPPFRLAWARELDQQRLGTAMEPIVAADKVFVATHQGDVFALEAGSGQCLWRYQTGVPFLHSPACGSGLVVAAATDGRVFALEQETGRLRWVVAADHDSFSAAPVIEGQTVLIGSRRGRFLAVEVSSGRLRWTQPLGAPIRQTAAADEGRAYVTAEDLRVRCFDTATGQPGWISEPLVGQSARDYYPVVVRAGNRKLVVVRTNPLVNMAQRIGRDRQVLCQDANVDASTWQKLEAWIKSDGAQGNPALWAKEQAAVVRELEATREARSFFVLEASTGQEVSKPPVFWAAGCQGVGAPPALTSDGRLLVFYRSAYGNWNHGVAPLVALGLLDLTENRIAPLVHQQGRQPPWNTFWGTADESQSFVVAGNTVLIVHQGTLSGFDLGENRLFHIQGQRDTFGGFPNPGWARNEWHGPGRGGVAVVGQSIFWLTGSRLLCLRAGEPGPAASLVRVNAREVPTQPAPAAAAPEESQLRAWLAEQAAEALAERWAPLCVEPGLAGREFFFEHSGTLFEALAWAYPHLSEELQRKVKSRLAEEWVAHPPCTAQAWYSLKDGTRRELFPAPAEVLSRLDSDKPPHPFANLQAIWLYANRCGEKKAVLAALPQLKACFEDFQRTGWRLSADKGSLYANRYLGSLLAFSRMAAEAGDSELARRAAELADQTLAALAAWWRRAASRGTLTSFKNVQELDPFIGAGDAISFRLAPHRHKLALLSGLTPEVAAAVREKDPEAVEQVWRVVQQLYATWHLVGEERQVHFGENYLDTPDLALGVFQSLAWLRQAPFDSLARHVDMPFCRADLFYLIKLALPLESRKRG
jgi:outer membrane protein assembly factor BamB